MLPPFAKYLRTLYGRPFGKEDFVALFSVRLDETGTDGLSPYALVGGAVSTDQGWDKLEPAWDALLGPGVHYHWDDFQDRKPPYRGWSAFKCKRFVEKQEKIIKRFTAFRISIGIESAAHADIKNRMKGIRGFRADSDYSLCLRYLMFATSEQLLKVDPDHRLSILVEDGPWAKGALETYQRVAAMTGPRKPAKHAHRLAGFAMAPKGTYRSLEAADYIAGSEHAWMATGQLHRRPAAERLSVLLTRGLLEEWYEGMIEEKEARRAFDRARKGLS